MLLLPIYLSHLGLSLLACRSDDKTAFITDRDEDGVSEEYDCDDENGEVGSAVTFFLDADRDGYGWDPYVACERPAGYADVRSDCDDANSAINPAAVDICDGLDNDCDGTIDDGEGASAWYLDADGDGFGDDATEIWACEAPETGVVTGGDCDEGDAAINPGAVEADCADPTDYNCDGSVGYADVDGDGTAACEDCNDSDAAIYPGANEVCDTLDNDCDGSTDEDASGGSVWYADWDADGYGDAALPVSACEKPDAYVADATDCDDGRDDIHPAATEVCNLLDDDCDGLVDDADDSTDVSTGSAWYTDLDADGYGAGAELWACTQPLGAAAVGGDCDDADPAYSPGADESDCADSNDYNCDGSVAYEDFDGDGWAACEECDDSSSGNFPGGTELCDGLDNNCDGTIDEEAATDAAIWYADTDGDTFGDLGSMLAACSVPAGYVGDATDCDDDDSAVSPAETEICNGLDDNCDAAIDENSAADAVDWYQDGDGDDFGNEAISLHSCEAPVGYLASAGDCDDSDVAVNPLATEVCNLIDDNCDSQVDEGVESTFYADADADAYGNPAVSISECHLVSGYVGNDDDCDDADASAYPGAIESYDGTDNDCDGSTDDTEWSGTGSDGDLSVTGVTTIGDAWAVSAITGATLTVVGTPSLAVGDEVLLINMHGSDGAHTRVGNYEFARVQSNDPGLVTLTHTPGVLYGEVGNADLTGQAVQIVRVPNYGDVTVAAGALLTASAWNGVVGGVLAFRSSGVVSVASGGVIAADELGYWAGETGTAYNYDAFQGESYAGTGDGNLPPSGGYYGNWAAGYYRNNYGGGGAMITGGGGNYGGGATDGASWYGGTYPPSEAGDTYGDADLSSLFLGSGGAGVWRGNSSPGPGGDGAGIVFIAANEIVATGTAAISSLGGTTTSWATGTWTYGAGGGAGGSIWIVADTLTLGTDSLDASGGFGEDTHIRQGGDGGFGRIRVDFNSINTHDFGSGGDLSSLTAGSTPDVGYSETP